MKKLILGLVFLISFGKIIHSQNSASAEAANNAFNKPPVSIMSPDVASLGKYGTYTVNHYTGTPNISIPIYEFKSAGLSVPISISYDASGFIPNKNAGTVGQNWNLSAGGIITRVVNGVPDDKLHPNPAASSNEEQVTMNHTGYIAGIKNAIALAPQSHIENLTFLESDGEVTYEIAFPRVRSTDPYVKFEYNPDVFSFNFLGHSGTFVMGNDGEVKVNSDRRYKVDLAEFKTQYNIPQVIDQQVQNNSLNSYEFSKIILTADDGYKFYFGGKLSSLEISFQYTHEEARTVAQHSGVISAWHLTKIVSPTGEEIVFDYGEYTSDEQDVLRHISDYNGNAGSWDNKDAAFLDIRLFWNDHKVHYNLLDASGSTVGYSIQKSLIKMAYLKKIESNLMLASFSYVKRNEYGQNKFYTTQQPPASTPFETYVSKNFKYFTSRLDKIVIEDKVGVLRQIPNEEDPLPAPKIQYNFTYEFIGNQTVGNRLFLKELVSNNLKHTFNYNRIAELQHPLTAAIDKWGFYNAQPNVRLVGLDGVPAYGDPAEFESNFTFSGQIRTANASVADIGLLQMITFPTGGTTEFEFEGHKFSKILKRKVNAPVNSLIPVWEAIGPNDDNNAGGCRIKKIISKPDVGVTAITTEYKYIKDYNTNPNGASSGLLTEYGVFRVRMEASNGIFHDQISDQNIARSNGFSESHICYSQVVEINGNGSEGYTKYSFTNPDNQEFPNASPDNYTTDPGKIRAYATSLTGTLLSQLTNQMKRLARFSSRFSERGKLQKKEVYNNLNSLLSSQEYKYNESTARFSEKTVGYDKIYNQRYGDLSVAPRMAWFLQSFHIYHYHNNISQLIENTYVNGGVLTQTTNFSYKSNSNPLLTQKKVTRSDGAEYTFNYYYPEDRIGFSDFPASAGMVSSNMVAQVVEEQSFLNTTPLQSQKYIYQDVTGNGGYKPIKNYVINHTINNSVFEEMVNLGYYPDGNLKEIQKKNDSKTVYLWDYKRSFPVAEVKNVPSAEGISITSFETIESGNQDNSQFVYASGATIFKNPCPTGSKVFNLGTNTNTVTRSGLQPAGQYVLSFWHSGGAVAVGGFSPIDGETVNGWTYKEYTITGATNITISGSGFLDEVRLYPRGAFFTSYTYQPLFGIISQCDINNKVSRFVYDYAGRLNVIMDPDNNILKKYCYNYSGQPENCNGLTLPPTLFYNDEKLQVFNRNNCGACQTGSQVTYIVPANTYSSPISKQAANDLAQNDVNTNGQNYANINGTCTTSGSTITYTNSTNISGFTATYISRTTGQTYVFNIPASSSGTLGCLPADSYSLSIFKSGNGVNLLFSSGCYNISGTTAHYSKVNVPACNHVSIINELE